MPAIKPLPSPVFILTMLVAALTLGGCAYQWRSVTSLQDESIMDYYNYAAGGKELRTDVIGNPFSADGTSDATVRDTIIGWMQGQPWGVPTTLTASHDTPAPDFRFVVRLNPPKNVHAGTVCETHPEGGTASEKLYLMMAFCAGSEAKSTVETWLAHPQGLDDPVVRDAVRFMARQVIPAHDPKNRRDCVLDQCD